MTELCFTAEEKDVGSRIDKFISDSEPSLTRSSVQKLIDSGFVTCNSALVQKNINSGAVTRSW